MEYFGTLDYIVFVIVLLLCLGVGMYFGFFNGVMSVEDYLLGGRKLTVLPVAGSIIASLISGITLLGTPAEIYVSGTSYEFLAVAVILTGIIMHVFCLPVFHALNMTSFYQYLEMRFNRFVRTFGSFLFFINLIIWIPIVIFMPALAFSQVTGINVHLITLSMCFVCTFYTCVGGMKAVIYTDVFQAVVMFGSLILVIIKGVIDIGGFAVVWKRNMAGQRLEWPSLTTDLSERHSMMVMLAGAPFVWLSHQFSQMIMQRYMALPSLKQAKRALWVFVLGGFAFISLCCFCGLVIFAHYYDCDPLTTKEVKARDQLFPFFVMHTFQDFPGVPGIFLAGVFSAALSTMSTALNSISAVVLEDFFKLFSHRVLTERETSYIVKTVVIVMGIVYTALVFVVEKMTSLLQVHISLSAICNGPTVGLFLMGLLLPWANSFGAILGSAAGLCFMAWVSIGAQSAITAGHIKFTSKPISVDGCIFNYAPPNSTILDPTRFDVLPLFRISYMWYTLLGCIVTIVAGLFFSLLYRWKEHEPVNPILLSPIVRKLMRFPYDDNSVELQDLGYKVVPRRAASSSVIWSVNASVSAF